MADQSSAPQMEDLVSVGSRISWGAIAAGAVVALAIQFLLGVLGAAVGVSVRDRVETENLQTAALIWSIVTICASLFVGGLVTSQFTVGENKMEAVLYGIIMWGFLYAVFLGLGAAGASVGFNAFMRVSEHSPAQVRVPDVNAPQPQAKDAQPSEATLDAAKRISWFVFGGTWISMFAAAAGAWIGAGPTFRLVTVSRPARISSL